MLLSNGLEYEYIHFDCWAYIIIQFSGNFKLFSSFSANLQKLVLSAREIVDIDDIILSDHSTMCSYYLACLSVDSTGWMDV